jgi:hypothetical protein
MTPEEELARLNRLIHQYESVYRTTANPEQRERVGRQLRELRGTREKILAVHVIDPEIQQEETEEPEDELAPFPLLRGLRAENAGLPAPAAVASFAPKNVEPTASQEEMFNLSLYTRRFEREFLPFLTVKHLKLDFKFSLDRDSFYGACQDLQRSLGDYREECRRLGEGVVSKNMERETRARALKLTRRIAVDGAKLFRGLERFASELRADAASDGTKCLNGDAEISFDAVEGRRELQGRHVSDALGDLARLCTEAVAYLNVPEIDIQESERADRH